MFKTDHHLDSKEQLIINGCIAGNRSFQSMLYEKYAPKMLVVCMRYAQNREEAEETMQEGFYRVFKYIAQFKNTGSFEGWIRKIMVNASIQKYRSRSNIHPLVNLEESGADVFVETEIYAHLEAKELIELIRKLPTSYRMIFNLYVFEGYKHREIAALLGISEGTSKSNLHDARRILQIKLAGREKKIIS